MEQVQHGKFLVDRQGILSLAAPEAVIGFAWHSAAASCRITADRMDLRIVLGRVPSSSQGAGNRAACLAMLRDIPALLPPPCRVKVLPDYRVVLMGELHTTLPSSMVELLTAVIGWVLGVAPYQELMLAEGLEKLHR